MKNLLFIVLIVLLVAQKSYADSPPKKVFLMEIKAPIDPRTNRYTKLAMEEAVKQNVDLIVLEMDTYGGAVNDADEIRQRFLDSKIPIFVFINKNAASAGALISIACDSIYMTKGANIGAATVVNGTDGEKAPDKYQSYMRSMMRSTAEAKGRNPKIAEAMVDENLEVDSISEIGQVITFTTSEAIKNGFCEAEVSSIDDVIKKSGFENYETIKYEESWSEDVIKFFLNPAVSGILILIMLGGIYFELQTPGVGFPLIAAVVAAIFYFTPYYLNGLAENWEILLFVAGLILIGVELFVIPGFGVTGIGGIIMVILSLILVMLENDTFDFTFVPTYKINRAVTTLALSMLGTIIAAYFGGKLFAKTKAFSAITLQDTLNRSEGYSSSKENLKQYIGQSAKAYTVLRPSGKVMLNGKIYDAETRGEFIEADSQVNIIGIDTNSLVVKKS